MPQGWAPIPGPVDRVTFFEEQARHRRATWRITALCALTILITAIPVSAILSPYVYFVILLAARLIGLAMPIPPLFWVSFRVAWDTFERFIDNLDANAASPATLIPSILTIAPLLLPGILAALLGWWLLRSILLSGGVGGVLLSLGARDPRPTELEEQQLVNVAAEMAVAAGVPPPRVMLLDLAVANAAVVGSSPRDATILITRGLLDGLNRDQTQGVIGHLVGSIGNGDLRIALTIVSVFQAFGLVLAVVDAPYSGPARSALWGFVRSLFTRGSREAEAAEAEAVSRLLAHGMGDARMAEVDRIMNSPDDVSRNKIVRGFFYARRIIFIPFVLAGLFAKIMMTLFGGMMMGPAIAFAWRTRRFLADATAVQMTRNPDGLAQGLEALIEHGGPIPGSQWATHLFIVPPQSHMSEAAARIQQSLEAMRQRTGGQFSISHGLEAAREVMATQRNAEAAVDSEEALAQENIIHGDFHPPLHKRMERLRAIGAHLASGGQGLPNAGRMQLVGYVLFAPLFLLIAALSTIALGLASALAFLVFEVGFMIVMLLLLPR